MLKLLFLLLAFPLYAFENAVHIGPHACSVQGYEYTGLAYSDTFNLPGIERKAACDARMLVNEPQLKSNYDTNHSRINVLVEQMLALEDCRSLHPILVKYKGKLTEHSNYLDKRLKERMELSERIKKSLDVQRWFAIMASYNNACSAEENNRHNFFDLDTLNEILAPSPGLPEIVTKDGQEVADCSDVRASGEDDLKGFSVSLEKAKGETLQFYSDVYGIPDHLTIKDEAGNTIYDTGCVANGSEKGYVEIPIPKKGKKVTINIINTCEDPTKKDGSMWELNLKCKTEDTVVPVGELCTDLRDEFIERLKRQVNLTKEVLNAEVNQLQCLAHLNDYIVEYLVGGGFVILGKPNQKNSFCDSSPEECEIKRRMRERQVQADVNYSLNLMRKPARMSGSESYSCGSRPDDKGSLLDVVSWSYCVNASDRLDVKPQ